MGDNVCRVEWFHEASDLHGHLGLGGCEDDEFREPSRRLLEAFQRGELTLVLFSRNFKHIVNLKRIHAFNAVNLKRGYPLLEIRTPREVADDE